MEQPHRTRGGAEARAGGAPDRPLPQVVIGAWIVLTLFGGFSAGQVSKRWLESFSIPGYSAYEANQRTLKMFGSGERAAALRRL